MKILFVSGFRTEEKDSNVGDEFIREGAKIMFDQLFPEYESFYLSRGEHANDIDDSYGELQELSEKEKTMMADLFVWVGGPVFWKVESKLTGDLSTPYNVGFGDLFHLIYKRKEAGLRNILLGVGSAQFVRDNGKSFLEDPICRDFAESMNDGCDKIFVRDKLAFSMLKELGISSSLFPCPSFFISKKFRLRMSLFGNVAAINVMARGGYCSLQDDIDEEKWKTFIKAVLPEIRKKFRILFLAHNKPDKKFMSEFVLPGEKIFLSHHWFDYLEVYSRCSIVISNRIHGAMCAASFGRPTLIVGNDSRMSVGEEIGIPTYYVSDVRKSDIMAFVEEEPKQKTTEDLETKRESTFQSFLKELSEVVMI